MQQLSQRGTETAVVSFLLSSFTYKKKKCLKNVIDPFLLHLALMQRLQAADASSVRDCAPDAPFPFPSDPNFCPILDRQ